MQLISEHFYMPSSFILICITFYSLVCKIHKTCEVPSGFCESIITADLNLDCRFLHNMSLALNVVASTSLCELHVALSNNLGWLSTWMIDYFYQAMVGLESVGISFQRGWIFGLISSLPLGALCPKTVSYINSYFNKSIISKRKEL